MAEDDRDQPARRFGYQPLRGTVYGVRFGTPGNLPGPLPRPKERRWIPIALLSAGILLLVALAITVVVLT